MSEYKGINFQAVKIDSKRGVSESDSSGKVKLSQPWLAIEPIMQVRGGEEIPKPGAGGFKQMFRMIVHLSYIPGAVAGNAVLWSLPEEYATYSRGQRKLENLNVFALFSEPFGRIDSKGEVILDSKLLQYESLDMLVAVLCSTEEQKEYKKPSGGFSLSRAEIIARYDGGKHREKFNFSRLARLAGLSFWDKVADSNSASECVNPGEVYETGVKKFFTVGTSDAGAARLYESLREASNKVPDSLKDRYAVLNAAGETVIRARFSPVKVWIPQTFDEIVNILYPAEKDGKAAKSA